MRASTPAHAEFQPAGQGHFAVTALSAGLAVNELDAGSDRIWFTDHPDRLFRGRRAPASLWVACKRSGTILRTLVLNAPTRIADTDAELAVAWFQVAFNLSPPDAARAAHTLLLSRKR